MGKCPIGYSWSNALNKCVKTNSDKGFIVKPTGKSNDPGYSPKVSADSLKKGTIKSGLNNVPEMNCPKCSCPPSCGCGCTEVECICVNDHCDCNCIQCSCAEHKKIYSEKKEITVASVPETKISREEVLKLAESLPLYFKYSDTATFETE